MTVRTLMYKMRDLIDEGWGEAEVHGFGPIDDVYKHISSDGKKYVSIDIFQSFLEGEDNDD